MSSIVAPANSGIPEDWPLDFFYGFATGYRRLDFDLDLFAELSWCWTPIVGFYTMIDDIMESFVAEDFDAVNEKMSNPELWTQYETGFNLCKVEMPTIKAVMDERQAFLDRPDSATIMAANEQEHDELVALDVDYGNTNWKIQSYRNAGFYVGSWFWIASRIPGEPIVDKNPADWAHGILSGYNDSHSAVVSTRESLLACWEYQEGLTELINMGTQQLWDEAKFHLAPQYFEPVYERIGNGMKNCDGEVMDYFHQMLADKDAFFARPDSDQIIRSWFMTTYPRAYFESSFEGWTASNDAWAGGLHLGEFMYQVFFGTPDAASAFTQQ